jgi:hypothetical protein
MSTIDLVKLRANLGIDFRLVVEIISHRCVRLGW